MKKTLLFLAVAIISLTATAQNRGQRGGQRFGDPRQGMQRMAEHLAKEMKLNNATTSWFVPLYVEYRDTLMKLQRPQRVEDKALQEMDDAAVTTLIEQSFAKDAAVTAIKRDYLAKFREKLSEKQVYRAMIGGMRPRGGDRQHSRGNFRGGFPGGGQGGFSNDPGGNTDGGGDF